MSDTPSRASAVIIGAGIVGNSLVHHLARLGWRDLVLVDKGPMPNPGGSTGHASNFIFPIEYSKMMMELTRDSTEQYQALGGVTQSGGVGGARQRHGARRARAPGAGRAHQPGRHRDADLRDLLWRLEPAHRADGGRADPAHPDRAPDDQRRPGAAVRRHLRRDRLPDRA